MKTFKQAAVVIATVGMMSMQAHAGESAAKSTPAVQRITAFSQNDINGLFDQADQPMQLATLSQQEMKETEGAWVHWAAGAALGGAMNTAAYIGSNRNWTYGGAAWAAAGGLIGGLPVGSAAGRAGLAALGMYTASQPWGGYRWAQW